MSLPYKGEMIQRARELRRSMTDQERKLWYLFLSKYPIRFQRQKTISGFIVDFYCSKAMLVIEIDGKQHHTEQGLAYDLDRAAVLDRYHVKVIRFDNGDIDLNFNIVCRSIDEIVKERLLYLDNKLL